MKIGSSSGSLGAEPSDPYAGIARPLRRDDDAPGVSWFSATRAIANGLACDWFSQYGTTSLEKFLEKAAQSDQGASSILELLRADHPGWLEDPVVPRILDGADSLGEFVPFQGSPLAEKIEEFFASRNVIGEKLPHIAVGGLLFGDGETAMTWAGPWSTEFGTRTAVRLEIRKDKMGKEWAYFHSNLVVATRKPDPHAENYTKFLGLPRSIASHLFIAETPFPSSIMSFSRSMAYQDVPEGFLPVPLASADDFTVATFALRDDGKGPGTVETQIESMPKVIRAGYAVSSDAEDYFEAILPTVIDAVVNLATIAEDGFRNYRNAEVPNSFDHLYCSTSAILENVEIFTGWIAEEGKTAGGHSRYIPEQMLGPLFVLSRETYSKANPDGLPEATRRRLLEWVVSEGVGGVVSGAINTLCFSYLIPEQRWQEAETLLQIAIDLDYWQEGTNALCNLGQLYHARGDREAAKETLLESLNRVDKFAEAEACYHLGNIFAESGEAETAAEYWQRGAKAAELGPDQTEYADKCRANLSGPRTTKAKFCTQCGTALTPDWKFCKECGSAITSSS